MVEKPKLLKERVALWKAQRESCKYRITELEKRIVFLSARIQIAKKLMGKKK